MNAMEQAARSVLDGRAAFLCTDVRTGEHVLFDTQQAMEAAFPAMANSVLPCVTEGGALFWEQLRAAPELVILGGGHISQPLCAMAAITGMHVTVVDDRAAFAQAERFPQAARVVCGAFAEVLAREAFSPSAFFVIVTCGHAADTACLEKILTLPRRYVGMIGSRRKVAQAMEEMRALGFADETLREVHAPIGLPIGAQTPAEIAVSILAEIISVLRAPGESCALEEDVARAIRDGRARGGKLFTILEKRGSAPRGPGARMLVLPDGSTLGTIGGGSAEYACIARAVECMGKPGCEVMELEVKSVGMTCGGTIRVLMETI